VFEDEATTWSEEFLERLRQGDRIIVPAHWAAEVANALLMGVRRKRIKPEQPQQLWKDSGVCRSTRTSLILTSAGAKSSGAGRKHGLTVYDAAYLELARRYELPLRPLMAIYASSTSRGRPLL